MKVSDAVKGYLLSCRSKCNEKTIRWYRQKLLLLAFILADEFQVVQIKSVTVVHLRLFIERVKETKADELNPHKPTRDDVNVTDVTVKGYVQVVKSFFNWCYREELITKNPADKLDNPTVARYVIKTFTNDQIVSMLAACNVHTALGYRDYVIILLLLDTGIRVNELCTLALDRVYLDVREEAFIKVMGKGRKEREVGVSYEVARHLWRYIHQHRTPKNSAEQIVFINKWGDPLTPNGIEQLLHVIAVQTGITGVRVSPHTFRHTFARMFLENGGDVYRLSLLLGHSSVTVTENYLKDFYSRNARVGQNKFSPVAGLEIGKKQKGFKKRTVD